MITTTALEALVSSAYTAAIAGDGWDSWLRDLAGGLGSVGGLFGVINRRSGALEHAVPLCDNARGWEEYIDGMGRTDPHARHIATRTGAVLQTGDAFFDPTAADDRDYHAWEEDRFGFHSSVMLAGPVDGDRLAGFSLHFNRNQGHLARHSRDVLAGGHRGIMQAMVLGFTHHHKLQDSYWAGLSARSDGRATWLLGEQGQILRLNDAAVAMLAGDVLTVQAGQLACRARGHAALRAAIRAAVETGQGGTVPVPRADAPSLVANLYPLPRSRRALVASEAAALLIVDDPVRPLSPAIALWQHMFDLTLAEARVADALRDGEPDDRVAAGLGVRVSTVRTHLKAVHAKTETRSKAELVALLGRCAPL